MAEPVEIEDPDDERLTDFRDLKRADRRPDRPGGRGLVLAEGAIVVRRLLASPYPVRALLGVRRRYEELRDDLAGVPAPFYITAPDTMAQAVGFHLNRGVLASADRVEFPPVATLLARSSRVAVLEGVGDHENLGAIFRNAAALGVDTVLLADGCADPLYRRSVRVSMGTVLLVPFGRLPSWSEGGAELLRHNGFLLVALTPRVDAVPLSRWTASQPSWSVAGRFPSPAGSLTLRSAGAPPTGDRLAVLLGSEGPGLTEQALGSADVLVRIPMAPGVDSLNVATAGAIAFAALAPGSDR